jgi:hypothetical protein
VIAEVRVAAKYAEREQREAQKREREELAREERERDSASPEQAFVGVPADDPTGPDEPIGVKEEPAAVVDEPTGVKGEPVGAPVEPVVVRDEPRAATPTPAADEAPVSAVPPSVEGGPGPGAPVEPEPFASAFIDEALPERAPAAGPLAASAGEAIAEPPPARPEDVSRLVDSMDSARVDDALIGAPPDIQAVANEPIGLADEPSLLRSTGPEVDGTPVIVTGPSDDALIGVPPGVQPVADEPVDRGVPGSADDVPVIAFKPADAVPPPPEPAPPPTPPEAQVRVNGPSERVRVVVRDPVTRPAPGPAEDAPPPIPPEPAPNAGGARVLADGVASSPASLAGEASPIDRLPVISTKPLDDAERSGRRRVGTDEEGAAGFGAIVLAAVAALGALLSRFLQPISRLQRGEPIIDEEAPPLVGPSVDWLRTSTSSWAGGVRERTARLVEGARAGERSPRLVSTVETATAAVSSWVASLRKRGGGLARSFRADRPEPPSPEPMPISEPEEPAIAPVALKAEPFESAAPPSIPVPPPRPSPPFEPSPPGFEARAPRPSRIETPSPPARPRAPAIPPPPTTDLDVVPLAEPVRPREPEEEDTYDDGRGGELLRAAWASTKILLVIAIAVGSTVYAAVNWRIWFPKAAELGEATFTELDRVARSAERAAQQQRAVEELSAELPHLAPETIRLILSRSPSGVLEASVVFEIAGDATDRGFAALTSEEAREVDELGIALHDGLGPLERERLRDYANIRARRVVFAEEHAHALALVARGARILPAEKRARLQGLLSKAISAGLDPPPAGRRQ